MGLRLAFMGSPDFSVPTLEALLQAGHEIVAVYTQPPKPRGRRGLQLALSPVHKRAESLGLSVYTPKSLKDIEQQVFFQNLQLDAAIIVAYGLLLPKAILDAPRLGCYNLHASLLPRWRGAAPIARAIMAGDKTTGAMVMKMDEGLDTGAVLSSFELVIEEDATCGEVSEALSQKGATLMVEAVARLSQGNVSLRPQSEEGAVYAAKILKEEARISWQESAFAIQKKICGLSPFPGAYCEMLIQERWERVKLLKARLNDEYFASNLSQKQGGILCQDALLKGKLVLYGGDGAAIEVLSLQKAGGKVLSSKVFLQGAQIRAIQ